MFDQVVALPPDPLLGISIAYRADTNPNKVDLGVGVYKDDQGNTPIFSAVKKAEQIVLASEETKSYIGSAGSADYNARIIELIFSVGLTPVREQRITSVQTPGGCGALRLAAEFIKRQKPNAKVWCSDPTWANHQPLIGDAGLQLATYPYYDFETSAIRREAMLDAIAKIPADDVLLLHGCCHNPSGADLSRDDWHAITDIAQKNGFLVFIDLAYQGFGEGLEDDVYGVRFMAERLDELVVASSGSKNFSLYRDRVGSLSIMTKKPETASAVQTHLNKIARGIYSMPPAHGASIIETLLADASLKGEWENELAQVRNRVKGLRLDFSKALREKTASPRFDFIENQSGMFSFLGITETQVNRLRDQFSIYIAGSSRINIAGLSGSKIPYVTDAIHHVIGE